MIAWSSRSLRPSFSAARDEACTNTSPSAAIFWCGFPWPAKRATAARAKRLASRPLNVSVAAGVVLFEWKRRQIL